MSDFSDLRKMLAKSKEAKDLAKLPEMRNFLAWLDKNTGLVQELKKDVSAGKVQTDWNPNAYQNPEAVEKVFMKIFGSYENANSNILGIWLGLRYLCDTYGVKKNNLPAIKKAGDIMQMRTYYVTKMHTIFYTPVTVGLSPAQSFFAGLAGVVHEGTHGLKQMKNSKVCALSELSTAIATYDLTIPFPKFQELEPISVFAPLFGKRNSLQGITEMADGNSDAAHYVSVQSDYLAHFAFPWIRKWLKENRRVIEPLEYEIQTNGLPRLSKAGIRNMEGAELRLLNIYSSNLKLETKVPGTVEAITEIFCKTSGIANEGLMNKIRELFNELEGSGGWQNEKDFLGKLVNALNKTFGKPVQEKVMPEGYSDAGVKIDALPKKNLTRAIYGKA